MSKKQFEAWMIHNPRKALILCAVLGLTLAAVPIGYDMQAEKRKAEEQAEQERQQAEAEKERKALYQRQREKDEDAAKMRGLTYEEYKEAEELAQTKVIRLCRDLVEANARWGVDWNFFREFKWARNRDTNEVVVWGHDLTVKNAFNAERVASYACKYDIKMDTIKLTKFE